MCVCAYAPLFVYVCICVCMYIGRDGEGPRAYSTTDGDWKQLRLVNVGTAPGLQGAVHTSMLSEIFSGFSARWSFPNGRSDTVKLTVKTVDHRSIAIPPRRLHPPRA